MAPIDNDSPVPDAGRRSLLGLLTRGPAQLGILIILLILWAVFSSLAPGFLSRFNLNSMGRSVAIDVVVGFAQMVVLATGGMNLSVGAIGVCCVMAAGYLMQLAGLPIPVAILLTLAFGGFLGALNGLAIVKTGVNSFIVTLASASLFSGGMLIFTKGVPLNGLPATFGAFGRSGIGPIPSLAIVAFVIGATLYILFKHTVLGRQVLAVGANARTAEMSGIPVGRITIFVHVLSGVLAGAAALMLTSRLSAAMPAVAGDDWLLPSFLAPVIGGTALAGGMVSVIGTILGALLVATIRSGLLVLQVGNFWLQLFLGIFLLSAILFERYRTTLAISEQTRRA
ncbi:ABC transporter permease [Rhizobium sp. WYJ-E13]|uniref:ABC transporter permease n=1 Tax=unclassified Rhizobium TaxID=2613769 RepID=UPI001C1EA86C|nr:ABC transporter permease [Rhizobium sp. WYJ-E13]QWW71056.1 ABC transporter permease [Rhizobium sp. WYJ-E13]